MSGSVTPARRPRDDSDDEEEDFEVSVDGESSARSNRSKRARLDDEDGDEDGDEDEEERDDGEEDEEDDEQNAPVLPDSFRRSPKGKGRAVKGRANGQSTSNTPKTHHPGSIVRVTLTDFVTYTKAEFNPGPNLNMVIGPNGTGKSTLVCAICIGLGWATKHLGRGKDLDEFVKHGAKHGQIEIELAADPQRHRKNPVITTKIKKGDKTNAEYLIDGKKENKKRVQDLCASFSIQVDNLCQFLPQDRVVEFAALSPVELLTQTQRAAAPHHMSEWHDQLKEWRKEQKQQQQEQQGLAESIKRLEDRIRQQEPDVQRLRERAELQEKRRALDKIRPLPEYNDAKKNHAHAKERRKEAVAELRELERRTAPNRDAILQKQDYKTAIVQKAVPPQLRMVQKVEASVKTAKSKIEAAADKINECSDQVEAEKNSTKTVRQSMPQLQRTVSSLKKALETPPPPFDAAAMNEQIREKTRQMRALDEPIEFAGQEVGSIGQQIKQREKIVVDSEAEKEGLATQAGKQTNKLLGMSRHAHAAWKWIQANRARFQGEVYGPPLVECQVKDPRHAPAVESMMQPQDALAFTVTTKADFDMLTDQVRSMDLTHMINIRASLTGLDNFRPPTTKDALRQYGLEGWLLELLEGPEPVLAMLCDNRNMHQAAYTFRDLSSSQFNALQQSPISSWVTAKQSYTITRRREYGDNATSTRVQDLRPARFFTDAPVDIQQASDLERKIAETKGEIAELKQTRLAKMSEVQTLKAQLSELQNEKETIESLKKEKQSKHSQYNALPTKLEHAENKVNEAKEKIAGSMQRLTAIEEKRDALCLEKGQCALDYANTVESWRTQYLKLYELEILGIEASSDLQQLEAQNEEEERLIRETQQARDQAKAREDELLRIGQRLQQQCREVEVSTPLEQELWDLLRDWDVDQLNTELVSLDARLDSLIGGGNQNMLREYEERKKEMETKTVRFHALQTALDTLEATIADVREKWEPELDALVEEISEAFAENFAKIQCAGEVGVYKDEDFEQWAIQIKVKFRENEPLSLLDSHRQSGGERAVSTIFYLMALQSLARAPFRVVDEINQGMDPRNERLVHSRMVDIACAEISDGRQGSQYFLITPKLLQGLKYHPGMKVHCIASGEHMPDDFREIDFATAAKRALELRGRQTGVAAG